MNCISCDGCQNTACPSYSRHEKVERAVLVGNPNSGKSALFNNLTHEYSRVSNFPGTTVDIHHAPFRHYTIYDMPGIYSIQNSTREDKSWLRTLIWGIDDSSIENFDLKSAHGGVILNVIDAKTLSKDLFLTQQLIDLGFDVAVIINFMDDAKRLGIVIDVVRLEKIMGVKFFPTSALSEDKTIDFETVIMSAKKGNILPALARQKYIGESFPDKLALETSEKGQEEIFPARTKYVERIAEECVMTAGSGRDIADKISDIMLSPVSGIITMVLVLAALFLVVGKFVAGDLVDFMSGIMNDYYVPFIEKIVFSFTPPKSFIARLLTGDNGILTMMPAIVIGVLLPLIAGFNLFLAILEDSGYLPRIAVLADRFFTKFGLSGKAVISMILGFGCVTLAIISTRVLSTKRERFIASFLLCFIIPCMAMFGIIIGILMRMGLIWGILYFGILAVLFVIAGKVLNRFSPGTREPLVIELPRLRMPRPKNILKKTALEVTSFMKESIVIFSIGALAVSLLDVCGGLDLLNAALAPIMEGLLKLPREMSVVFIMNLIRREMGTVQLLSMQLTNIQMLTSLVTLSLFVPCISALIVLLKEHSKAEAVFIYVVCIVLAFLVGGAVALFG